MISSEKRRLLISQGLCGQCGKNTRIDSKTECVSCADKRKTRQKKSYIPENKAIKRSERKLLGLCNNCGKSEPVTSKLSCSECLKHTNEKRNRSRSKTKDICYAGYGGYTCVCCGETEPMFLNIDHVNNDGAEHRKTITTTDSLYRWLIKNNFPSGFQILCSNCNIGKSRNGGICPHHSNPSHRRDVSL